MEGKEENKEQTKLLNNFFNDEKEAEKDIKRIRKNIEKNKEKNILDFLEKNKIAIRANLSACGFSPGPIIYDADFSTELIYEWFEKNGLKRDIDIFIGKCWQGPGEGYSLNFGKTKWKTTLSFFQPFLLCFPLLWNYPRDLRTRN